jgi:cation diffusion facilitator CzcD-associated flavoprotein CzcO
MASTATSSSTNGAPASANGVPEPAASGARPGGSRAYDVRTLIVGTGFSGLGMAIKLLERGDDDMLLIEKADTVGGTWRENTYPGCACDVPSHMYSFSFAPNPDWSQMYAPQQEIWDYLEDVADRYGVRRFIRFRTFFHGARWDPEAAVWRCELEGPDGRYELAARFLVSAVGGLHVPAKPDLPGLDEFEGEVWHSAEWNHDFPLEGKRVAVVGTGASAIQFVPEIVPQVAHLDLYQRTAPWVLPRIDRQIPRLERALYRRLPFLQRAYRWAIYWYLELVMLRAVKSQRFGRIFERLGLRHLARQVSDPDKRRKLTPRFEFGCKRLLMSNDYYPALDQPHVDVITEPIERVTPRGVVAGGTERPVDALILATGFDVQALKTKMTVVGPNGETLAERWDREGVTAHRGTMVAGFPNLFFLMGPNTGLGHNSVVFMAEFQIELADQAMRAVIGNGAGGIAPKESAQRAYNKRLQRALDRAVWSRSCKSWYLDEHGRNITLWPHSTWRWALEMHRLRPREYELYPAPAHDSQEPARPPGRKEVAA